MLGGSKSDIQRQDSELKKYGLLTLAIIISGITLTAGVTAAYLIATTAALSAAILYPDNIEEWFNTHRMLLIGALVGFFVGGTALGPITMVLGGFLGHLIEQPVSMAMNAATKTADAYHKVTQNVSQLGELPHSAWSNLKNGFERLHQYFSAEHKPETVLDMKPAAKPEAQLAEKTKSQGKVKWDTKPAPKAETRLLEKTETKAETKLLDKAGSNPIAKIQPKIVQATAHLHKASRAVQHPHDREHTKRVNKSLTKKLSINKPAVASPLTSQSLWQSFRSFFVTAPKVTEEDVIKRKKPTHLRINKQHPQERKIQNTKREQKKRTNVAIRLK